MSLESIIRVGSFVAILVIMGLAETLFPRRELTDKKIRRWTNNLSMAFSATLIVRIILPVLPTGLAIYCSEHGIGIMNMLSLPLWFKGVVSVLALDLLIYWQHVLFHRNRLLWRIHRMHHADLDIDASTGVRFHPIEIALSMIIKLTGIVLLGPPAFAVILFEVLLNGCALFNHANVRIPASVDAYLRLLVVTPDMHRVHHSTDMREANMNFGFNFPWWDRLFSTYKPQPELGHQGMKIGLNIFREPEFGRFTRMLVIPFV